MDTAIFSCSICGEESNSICAYCTKDTCGNHLCMRCHHCSDCCHCDVPLTKAHAEERRSLTQSPPEQMVADDSDDLL